MGAWMYAASQVVKLSMELKEQNEFKLEYNWD